MLASLNRLTGGAREGREGSGELVAGGVVSAVQRGETGAGDWSGWGGGGGRTCGALSSFGWFCLCWSSFCAPSNELFEIGMRCRTWQTRGIPLRTPICPPKHVHGGWSCLSWCILGFGWQADRKSFFHSAFLFRVGDWSGLYIACLVAGSTTAIDKNLKVFPGEHSALGSRITST